MNCGAILYDKQFQFADGTTLDKLIIILSDFGTNYLAVKTTSKIHRKGMNKGCQIKDKPANYFLPKNTCWFNSDTWVELDEVYEIDSSILNSKIVDNVILLKNELPYDLKKDVLKCALQSLDIELFYLEFIERAYENL